MEVETPLESTITIDPLLELSVSEKLLIDKLQLMYHQSIQAVVVTLFIGFILTGTLYRLWPGPAPMYWFAAMMATSILRISVLYSYRRAKPSGREILAWRYPYLITLAISSSAWGIGALFVVQADSLTSQAMIYYFLMGMAGGALAVYSSIRQFTLVAVLTVLGPMTLWMFMQASLIPVLMASASVIYLISAHRASNLVANAIEESFQFARELEYAKETAEQLSRTDTLTGLFNRRAFLDMAQQSLGQCQRSKQPYCLILLDVDHFKTINDSYGHATGDTVLFTLADIIANNLRHTDFCARFGGEEFVIWMPDTPVEGGEVLAEKLRAAIAEQSVAAVEGFEGLTASLGLSASTHASLDTLISSADKAMYQAKQQGRNRVCIS